jgi:Beta-lactamase class C and other penicillin binding proteins
LKQHPKWQIGQHMLNVIEQAKPRFGPTTDAAYQPLTFGWQVGGVLEKATGRPLTELMQHYLVEPLALDHAFLAYQSINLVRLHA